MKMSWPWTVRIFWDPWRNVPIIKPRQEEIDLLYQLKLSEPGDARPAFRGDLEKLKVAIVYEFGDDKLYSRIVECGLVLLNKVPHWDVMYEVISSGNVVGQLYYDPYSHRWRFRLTYQGAYIAVQENLVDVVKCQPPFYVGKTLKPYTSSSSRQVVVVDEKGVVRGLGEVDHGKVFLSKAFHDRSLPVETSRKRVSLYEVLRYNEEGLKIMEDKAIGYLNRLQKRFGNLKLVVSYSGGKDSLVALDLAYRACGELDILFNDTGLELPETLSNVEEVSKHYGRDPYIAFAGDIFWKAVEVFGPPGKDYRWCCKVAKLVPIAKLTKATWPSGALNIVGQRAFESLNRARSPLIWRNKWISHMLSTTPIQYWSQLACWLYIFKYKLPYNKLYEEGFDRLGCYICPSCSLAEFVDVKRIYPELWIKWETILEEWRRKLELPPEWITLGLWRWLSPATAKKRVAHRVSSYTISWKREYSQRLEKSKVKIRPVETTSMDDVLIVKFNRELFPEKTANGVTNNIIVRNLTSIGFKVKSVLPLILDKNGNTIEISGDVVKLSPFNERSFEDLVDTLKVIYRVYACVHCGSCVLWTGRGLVKLTSEGPLPLSELDEGSSRRFIEACPVSDQLVEKLVISLITGDYKSFKRKTRRARSAI